MTTKKVTIGPSAATFARGSAVMAETPSSCPRKFLARKAGFKDPVDSLYGAMGEIDEHRYKRKLEREGFLKVETQINFTYPLSSQVEIFGYIDMKLTYEDGTTILVEKKSHISKSQRLEIIRKQRVKTSHVAQLVTYLLAQNLTEGKIVCDYYEMDKDCTAIINTEGTEFSVEIDRSTHEILVNGEKYKYSLRDLAKFYSIMVKAIEGTDLPARPVQPTAAFKSPCVFCPLRELCNDADVYGWKKEEFLAKVMENKDRLLNLKKTRPPEIWAPANRRKKNND